MEDWQQRVVEEKEELSKKITKLHNYLYGDIEKTSFLGVMDYTLLQKQLIAMTEYFIILQQRISKF